VQHKRRYATLCYLFYYNFERKAILKIELIDTVVIGGGQAGVAAGYYLSQQKRDFVILDAHEHTGDSWRKRWDSLSLFTPASFNHLPGMPFPKSRDRFPTKDEMADYLESYAAHFQLPTLFNTKVDKLTRDGDAYLITADTLRLKANHVIVATGAYSTPCVPEFASQLDLSIAQLHSVTYRNPSQLRNGAVLIVGAGNSGVEIALDLASQHSVWLAGRDTGFIPAKFGKFSYELGVVVFKALMQRLTVDTPPGRWFVRRAKEFIGGHPVVGVTSDDLIQAGIQRVPRMTGVSRGQPILEDGRVLDVANVIWSTGFIRDYSWIKLPVFNATGDTIHDRGVVQGEPGLYFVGLPYQSSLLSGLVAGASIDAKYIAKQITLRAKPIYLTRRGKADKLRSRVSSRREAATSNKEF
jgi:putative flavoprotein involved in K+ transport